MPVTYHAESREFHLYNEYFSYIIHLLADGTPVNLYCGPRLRDRDDFSFLLRGCYRPLTVYRDGDTQGYSLQHLRPEYPVFGTGDFRQPALTVLQADGSRVLSPIYESHRISSGKPKLSGLPATYAEDDAEADTLAIVLKDRLTGLQCTLSYTVFNTLAALARSVSLYNAGAETLTLERALSFSLDLADDRYDLVTLSGAWSREREPFTQPLRPGIQGIGSLAGASSAEHNPFLMLKRPEATEDAGEVLGFSLVYSGNHYCAVQTDTFQHSRVLLGIHPDTFQWRLAPGESFQTPETVMVYSESGVGGMSRTFHRLYRTRLAHGYWRDRTRPLVINNWEATGPLFSEEQLLQIARLGRDLGLDLFVLDDGWFGNRDDDHRGLGDWFVPADSRKLPHGIRGLSEQVNALGMRFGLWFEPEMINRDSDLFRAHPDWILCAPGRMPSQGRNQYVLDFSRAEVVEYLYESMYRLLDGGKIDYIKWDMNRYITECYSGALPPEKQGEVYHRYILGVYALYDRLTTAFPKVLFESCASGGARFDPGLLYYAPQTWTSDDTDAAERMKIQYSTSLVYPISAISAHVSAVPNQQVGRTCRLETRGNVALFGAFGCELNPDELTEEEKESLRHLVALAKRYAPLVQKGDFYRLLNPYSGSECAWMVVSPDQRNALVGYYRLMVRANEPLRRLPLRGLNESLEYEVNGNGVYGGDLLTYAGLAIQPEEMAGRGLDFSSKLYELKAL